MPVDCGFAGASGSSWSAGAEHPPAQAGQRPPSNSAPEPDLKRLSDPVAIAVARQSADAAVAAGERPPPEPPEAATACVERTSPSGATSWAREPSSTTCGWPDQVRMLDH